MRSLGLVMIITWLFSLSAIAADGTADSIREFGLLGTWSIDCAKDPFIGCDKDGCGSRTTYELPPSGPPMMKYSVGEMVGPPHTAEFSIEAAARIAGDRISMTVIQRTGRGSVSPWGWQIVLLKEGNRFRTYSAKREDGKRIAAEDGFAVNPAPGLQSDEQPTQWVRSAKPTPWFEKCSD